MVLKVLVAVIVLIGPSLNSYLGINRLLLHFISLSIASELQGKPPALKPTFAFTLF